MSHWWHHGYKFIYLERNIVCETDSSFIEREEQNEKMREQKENKMKKKVTLREKEERKNQKKDVSV